MCLCHEGSMIGVQCQLMNCRGHIRAAKSALSNYFGVDASMVKLTSKSNFSLLSSFPV